MKVVITFKPLTIDLDDADDPEEAKEFARSATPAELEDYFNENWGDFVDPTAPLIEKIEVKE
jgi:hypothetical protein